MGDPGRPEPETPVTAAREPGWYRSGKHGWTRVGGIQAEAEVASGQGYDLVHIQIDHEEVPLW
jgi:hypothetical protein